jgi:phage protein D
VSGADPLREAAECVVAVDDKEIRQFYRYLREVKVSMSRKAAATATLVFDSTRAEGGEWTIQDSALFKPWRRIKVEARFGSYSEEILRGFIKEVKADCPEDMGAATLTVSAQDESILLDREHARKCWSKEDAQATDGQIVRRIAQDHGLGADAEEGLTNASLNSDGTYIRFLRDRAEANGYEVLVREGVLRFRPPDLDGAPQASILVYAGADSNCLRFGAVFDGHKPDHVRMTRAAEAGTGVEDSIVEGDLPLMGSESASSDDAGIGSFVWAMRRPAGATAAEALSRAKASANENAWKLLAEGELDGTLYGHVLLTHRTVNVDGIGDRYGGLYYVDEVQHVFNMQGYRQSFKLLRNAVGGRARAASDPLASVR